MRAVDDLVFECRYKMASGNRHGFRHVSSDIVFCVSWTSELSDMSNTGRASEGSV